MNPAGAVIKKAYLGHLEGVRGEFVIAASFEEKVETALDGQLLLFLGPK